MSAAKSVCLVVAATATALAASALFFSSTASAAEAAHAMPRIDVFSSSRSAVSEAASMKVQPGMSRDAITALIGAPAHTMRFPLSRTTAWDYPFVDSWGYASELSVVFDDGGTVVGNVTARNDY